MYLSLHDYNVWKLFVLGNNGKEKENSRSKEATSPAARSANGQYNL